MKTLILGATGMLGHRLFIELSKHHEVYGTYRNKFPPFGEAARILRMTVMFGKEARTLIEDLHPDVIINCIAAIPQAGYDAEYMISMNASFPIKLADLCCQYGIRLIHFSTDAVFSGKRGNYTEDDEADATDVYGMTKRLGEISDQAHVLTLRCCPIGRELNGAHSLVEWFLAQKGMVQGYANTWFNPLSTHEIARILNGYILPRSDLHGLYHVSGALMNKHSLLLALKSKYRHNGAIARKETAHIDRTLNGNRFCASTSYLAPTWEAMLEEMAADNALYEKVAI